MVRLVYARSRTIGGWLIRAAQWWSPYSHVAMLTNDNTVVHAVAGRGVVEEGVRPFYDAYHAADIVEVDGVDYDKAVEFARGQVGDKYDYGAVARFVSKIFGRGDELRWQCVELVESSLAAGGRRRFRIPLDRITVRQSHSVA